MANLLGTLITGNLRTTQGYGTSDSTRILYPGGGSFVTTTSVITGAIRIKMPVLGSGMMMTCTVKVYEYSTNKSFTITFGGHRDSANWYNEFCYIDGGTTRTDLTVRFGIDDGVNCVWIGETSSSWSYPQVFVTDAQLGYVGYSTSWLSGWAVDFVTAFGSVGRTQIAYAKITTANIGSQSVSYAASAGSAATATTASNLAADTSTRFKILTFTGVGGDSGNGAMPDSYAIYQQGGSWTHPYPDLCIGYHTGIKIGANSGYNGTRFYNDSNWATEIFSVGNGDNHVRVLNNLYVTGTVTGSNLSGTNTGDQTNISGSAGSVDGLTLTSSANNLNPDNVTQNQIGYNTSVSLFGQTDGGLYSSAYSSSWIHQIFGDFRTGQIAIRGKNANTWQAWRIVVDEKNVGSYAVPYGDMTSSTGLNDNKLYLRTNGDNNHYIWNAADDWEEIVAYSGTGLRIKSSTGVTLATFTTSGNSMDITGNAATASSVAWGNVSSKPGNIMYYQGFELNANTMDSNSTGFTYANNAPFYGPIARFSTGGGYDLWIGGAYTGGNAFYLRTRNGDTATLNPWREIITSGNIASQSVASAGNATTANGANGNFYIDDNFGNTVVGLYDSTRYQGVFAMGDSYKLPADGTTTGSLYGLAWSHPNAGGVAGNLNTHGLLVMENGTFLAAISGSIRSRDDMRAPIFYDSANTAYYGDFAGISSMYGVAIRGDLSSTDTSNQIFFWGAGNSTTSAIGFKANGGNFTNPTGAGDGYNTYFTMDSPGRGWVFREGTGGTNFAAAYTSGWILNNGVWQANASMRAPIFYDSQDTNYYVDPNSTSKLVQVNLGTVNTRLISDAGVGYLKIYGSASNHLGIGPYDNNGWVYFENSGNANGIYFNTPGRYAFDSVDVTPYTDNENSLGNGSYRWANIYTGGWLRNYGAQGIYNESYGNHWYATSNATWNAAGNNSSYVEIAMRTGGHQGSIRGYFYADSSANIGILNNAGNWSLLTNSSRNTTLYGQLTVGEGIGYSSIFMSDSDEGTREIHCNSNRIGFLTQAGAWGSWCYDNGGWATDVAMYSPIYYDSADNGYYLDPNADLSLRVYGEICNSNYAEGKMQPGALNIGRIDTNYAWDGSSWAGDVRLGILINTSETWEMGIHDSGDSVMSLMHFDGGSTITMGRNIGWGQCTVNSPQGYVSNGNPWSTANSAFFPNGITTAGGTNWIYGTTTFIGNAPGNGAGHDFSSSGHQYSTGSITTPLFLVNGHSDNTKGYRIHNTSGSSVSAMFTNSSNQLVIAAGAVDQINLNKKVYVNSVALGVNIAPSATAGRIDASNDIVAYSSSDERLKQNITPIANALDKVKSLTGVEFDWKPEHKEAHGHEGHDTGIIAQQVLGVMPSAVRTNDTGYLAVRYEKLIGLLIEGMKEQQSQIEELKAKLDGLTK